MADITKKFSDFQEKKEKKFDKDKEFEPLSDDMVVMAQMDDGSLEKIDLDGNIISIDSELNEKDLRKLYTYISDEFPEIKLNV